MLRVAPVWYRGWLHRPRRRGRPGLAVMLPILWRLKAARIFLYIATATFKHNRRSAMGRAFMRASTRLCDEAVALYQSGNRTRV